jgi:hypothetical protein
MELLDTCLTTKHFQFEDTFYQKKDGMALGNSFNFAGQQQEYICGKV